jgi:hypothetical protein
LSEVTTTICFSLKLDKTFPRLSLKCLPGTLGAGGHVEKKEIIVSSRPQAASRRLLMAASG